MLTEIANLKNTTPISLDVPLRQAQDIARVILAGPNLDDANLAGAMLAGADMENAHLEGANLAGAYLRDADLKSANLAGANLAGAWLAYADLTRAKLAGATYNNFTRWPADFEPEKAGTVNEENSL